MILKSIIYGFIGTMALLAVYFSVVSLISGWPFALDQFSRFWYFIISLAVGFGIQIGLYTYLKEDEDDTINQNNIAKTPSPLLGTQVNDDGGVTVAVTPKDPSDWSFAITLNTHSGNLSEDLTAVSILLDEGGNEYRPIS